jgi:hypothetical protein
MNHKKGTNNGCAHMAAKAQTAKPTLAATSHIQPLCATLKDRHCNENKHSDINGFDFGKCFIWTDIYRQTI